MIFKVRHGGIEDPHNVHDTTTVTGTAAIELEAGVVVKITGSEKVGPVTGSDVPYGFLLQRVKTEYANLPAGFRFRGDLGSSDAFVGDPVGVFVSGGIADTDSFDADLTGAMAYGANLYAKAGGKLTDDVSLSVNGANPVAVAKNSLTADAISNSKFLRIKSLL